MSTSCNFCAVVTTSLEEDTYTVNENNGSVTVCIRLEGDLERSAMVNLTTLSDTAQGKHCVHYILDVHVFSYSNKTVLCYASLPMYRWT